MITSYISSPPSAFMASGGTALAFSTMRKQIAYFLPDRGHCYVIPDVVKRHTENVIDNYLTHLSH
jgi:hypothetical protein